MADLDDPEAYGKDLKIILIGNASTGKTSIVDRYVNNVFREKKKATISPDFSYKLIKKNGIIYRLQFWDIPGQDRSPALTSIFCRDAHGFLFVCDCLVEKSRKDILNWKKSLADNIDISNLPGIIMENKCDLLGEEKDYEKGIEELKTFSEENNLYGAFRTSALNGYNIEKGINFLIDEVIRIINTEEKNDINNEINNKKEEVKKVKLTDNNEKSNKCC